MYGLFMHFCDSSHEITRMQQPRNTTRVSRSRLEPLSLSWYFNYVLSNEVEIFHKISVFLTSLLCFSSIGLYPESISAAIFTLPKNWRSTWMLPIYKKIYISKPKACQISHASKFSHFNVLNQSHLLLSKNDIHQAPTTAVHLQMPTLDSSFS